MEFYAPERKRILPHSEGKIKRPVDEDNDTSKSPWILLLVEIHTGISSN